METTRSDYKLKRNKEMYEKYISGDSLNSLAKQYKISPQRVSVIIQEIQEKGLSKKLKVSDPQTKREQYVDLAIQLREKGDLDISNIMFDEILEWDRQNNNTKGYISVLGHKKITLDRLAMQESDREKSIKYLKDSSGYANSALDEAKKIKDRGYIATMSVHYASSLLAVSKSKKTRNEAELTQALKVLNKAIPDMPGSASHKAWPMKLKAEILIELEDPKTAFNLLNEAELYLLKGYKKQVLDRNGELGLKVWLTGIWLAKSRACVKLGYTALAKMYADSIMNMKDETGAFNERKKEAKSILKTL